MKGYTGTPFGRIAGTNWMPSLRDYYTASESEQKIIENHPWFKKGIIRPMQEGAEISEETGIAIKPDYESYVTSLSWQALRALAKDRGLDTHGKKAVDLIQELLVLGE
jgi:hypothetical protein